MKYPMYISNEQMKLLQFEVLSQHFYIRLTRELLHWCEDVQFIEHVIARKNKIINLSRTITGGKIYRLESDDDGYYMQVEYDWHDSNFLLVFRTLSTTEFVEFMCELLRAEHFEKDHINELLEQENASFRFVNEFDGKFSIEVFPIEEIEDTESEKSHPNIRLLVERMENAFSTKDYSAVLHTSASIFETMAKDIIGIEGIQDKTLKSFFDRFRKDSGLPKEFLDYILNIYDNRNIEPLAGHGSTSLPKINKKQATTIKELTKAFVKIEYQLKYE